ncbi:unnamed protein product [Bursaphelenchus xylophilus]|uniref:(pine wood nematode) hypothetical protein n=1 Tax=Bursaphelenchus xylophilus TaxID=6326 RepID=A0A1I7SF92_BURXY|nr:unnamed protein product [Bursaphelenchus xylophilus]CAG9130459.1 unnamed protein product [Bursaphelenchus xylophilus]
MQAYAKMASLFSVVYVTVPSKEVGKSIARELVNSKVAACVNIVPQVTSIYEWDGNVQEDEEAMLIIKTKTESLNQLKESVLRQHPYAIPEIIAMPIEQGHEPYLEWINKQVQPKQ